MIQSFLSIIICTRNRANELSDCLFLAVEQARKFTDVEVLVVDNGSTDNTKDVVENVSENNAFKVRYVYEPIEGLCQARNRGRAESNAKVLAFIDDDVRIKKHWVKNVRQHFIDERSDCLGGKVKARLEGEVPFKAIQECMWFFGEVDFGDQMREYQPTDWLPNPIGCNMAFTTKLFDAVGGFNNAFKLYNDETEFFQRVKKINARILYVPTAEVEQYISAERLTKQELRHKSYLHGKGIATFWLLSSPNLFERIDKIAWHSSKVFFLFLILSIKPSFRRFFLLWFSCGYIVRVIKGLKKETRA